MSQYSELKALLDSGVGERPIVRWLKKDPENALILSRMFSTASFGNKIITEFNFGTHFKADFVLFAPFSGGFNIHLVEIEPPNEPLYTKKGTLGARLSQALKQVQDWKIFVDANRSSVINELDKVSKKNELIQGRPGSEILDNAGLPLYHPKAWLTWQYHIVIGRRAGLSDDDMRRKASSQDNLKVDIVTFDRLLDYAKTD
jgi:hypothetical protein